MDRFTEGTKAVVFFGENFVEIANAQVTLQDVCEAFELEYGAGVFIHARDGGHPVATLPSDAIYSPPQRRTGDAAEGDSAEPAKDGNAQEEEEDADDGEVLLLDLISPTGPRRQEEGSAAVAGGSGEGTSGAAGGPRPSSSSAPTVAGADGVTGESGSTATTAVAVEGEMDEAMRALVKLGAVELVSADSAQRIAQLPPYDPARAPGLFKRVLYPDSTYSPFRLRRDPLEGDGGRPRRPQQASEHARAAASDLSTFIKHGATYTSSVEVYGAHLDAGDDLNAVLTRHEGQAQTSNGDVEYDDEAVTAELLSRRPDLRPLTEEERDAFFA